MPQPRRALDAPLDTTDPLSTAAPTLHPLALADALFGDDPEDQQPFRGKLWARFPTSGNYELHVRVGWLDGTEFVVIIDLCPATGRSTTGVMVEQRLLGRLVTELLALHRSAAGSGSMER
jgi:hypothetical protein